MSSLYRKVFRQMTHPPCVICGRPTHFKNMQIGFKCTNPQCRKIRRQMYIGT